MEFDILGEVTAIEIIAVGREIRDRRRLHREYGPGRWRKLKGVAYVCLYGGTIRRAEIHWYEAQGLGKYEIKIKRMLD